jgi:hypothetical protein
MNFLLWGFYHGVLLMAAHRFGAREESSTGKLLNLVRVVCCFHLVLGGWLLFRVQSLDDLYVFITGMTSGWAIASQRSSLFLMILALAAIIHFTPRRLSESWRGKIAVSPAPALGFVYAAALLVFTAATTSTPNFIYFQF